MDDKPPQIKNGVITNTIEKCGLRFPNIDVLIKSQKAAWVKCIVENKDAVWMQLFYSTLPYVDLSHFLECSIDAKYLSDDILSFSHQVWVKYNF